jgi:hypothetical protein
MKYYLDTNAVYNIRNIPEPVLANCFSSVMTLIELVSGIKDRDSYQRRKAILSLILKYKLTIDWAMPEEIIFNSFDVFEEYEFNELRTEELEKLIAFLVQSETYELYNASTIYNAEFGHSYFKSIDDSMSKRFIDSTNFGIKEMKNLLNSDQSNNKLEYNGNSYNIDTTKALSDFLTNFPEVNYAFTINALATMIFNLSKIEGFTIEDVFGSYNGLVNIYISFMSKYSIYKLANQELPAKNDFIDITHILYMKNDLTTKVISDDKIFEKFMDDQVIKFSAVENL